MCCLDNQNEKYLSIGQTGQLRKALLQFLCLFCQNPLKICQVCISFIALTCNDSTMHSVSEERNKNKQNECSFRRCAHLVVTQQSSFGISLQRKRKHTGFVNFGLSHLVDIIVFFSEVAMETGTLILCDHHEFLATILQFSLRKFVLIRSEVLLSVSTNSNLELFSFCLSEGKIPTSDH